MMKDDDLKLLKGFALGRTNRRMDELMNEQTFVIVESLLQLKSFLDRCKIFLGHS